MASYPSDIQVINVSTRKELELKIASFKAKKMNCNEDGYDLMVIQGGKVIRSLGDQCTLYRDGNYSNE